MKRIAAISAAFILPLLGFILIPLIWPDAQAAADSAAAEGIYIVELAAMPLALYDGHLDGLAATTPALNGQDRLALTSPAAIAYHSLLLHQQAEFLAEAERVTGRSHTPIHSYQITFNGLALTLTDAEEAQLAALPGLLSITASVATEPLSDAGPRFIGAPQVWNGSATGTPLKGEGMVIGIVDTGIDYAHPVFADVGPVDGYDHDNPRGQLYGYCADTNPAVCNDKLIGIYDFSGDGVTPLDFKVDHGTFVAHIAAGNFVTYSLVAPLATEVMTLSGAAPHANIISYDVCAINSCYSHIMMAALEQVVIDQVDVMNFSIGGTPFDPWANPVTKAFLGVRASGVFVAAAAGNRGPSAASIEAGADALWLLSVGMASHDRSYANWVENMSGGDTTPPADIRGEAVSPGYGPAPIVHARDYDGLPPSNGADGQCRTAFPANTFSNVDGSNTPAIVLCDEGGVSGNTKTANVQAGGAGGIVLGRPNLIQYGGLFGYALPGMRIQSDDFADLSSWLATGTGHLATISGSSLSYDIENGDHLVNSSSRGPNPTAPDVMRPDVIAPGLIILSAEESGFTFGIGTSFSSPLAAGAAALIQAEHPSWSVAEVQSAIMSTAVYTAATKEDWVTPADPFDMGSGRVYVANAIKAGLIFDESAANFLLADPSRDGDPTTLNLASLTNNDCVSSCQWTRTVSNGMAVAGSWTAQIEAPAGITVTVTPTTFALLPGNSQTFTVSVDVSAAAAGTWAYGRLVWAEDSDGAPTTHLPMAVRPAGVDLPGHINLDIRRDQGSAQLTNLIAGDVSDLSLTTQGVVQAMIDDITLAVDPTPGDPFDNLNDGTTTYFTVTVPASSAGLVAEFVSSESPDVDLYVGLDDGDGLPAAGETLCVSALSSWVEVCRLAEPAPGIYWILVQNFGGSGDPTDLVTVANGVIPAADNGQLTLSGPAAATAGIPFEVGITWDLFTAAGDVWYGRLLFGDGGDPDAVAAVWLDIDRQTDDVSKSAAATTVTLGDTVSFTITIQPNLRWQDLHYTLTETLPLGLQIVSGSISSGGTQQGNGLIWQGDLLAGSQNGATIAYEAVVTRDVCLFGSDQIDLQNEVWHEVDDPAGTPIMSGMSVTVENLNSACAMVHHQFMPFVGR